MRSGNNNSYDFHCSSDSRFVKVAVKNNFYHTLRIEAQAARSINLTGGTRRVEEILITRCFKLTRIHWPKYTGAITRLRIFLAESITKLDLSSLSMEGLLELSILDCAKLTTITGLPATLKWLNIHGTNIDHIDVSHCQQLEVFNVSTPCPVFKADLTHLPALQSVSIVTTADKSEESHLDCQIYDCPSLQLININSGNIPASIDINSCPNLTKTAITGGHGTTLEGLSACTKLEFFHSDYLDKIKMNEASRRAATQHSTTAPSHPDSPDAKEEMNDIIETFTKFTKPILHPEPGPDDDETVVQLHGSPRERNHACMVRINLLSLPLEPLEERFTEAFNKRAKPQIETLPHYLNSSASYIYYLDKIVKKSDRKQLEQAMIISTQEPETLISWLQHPVAHKPLMITEESLKSPPMIEFLESYHPDKKLVIYKNKFYRLTPTHKIVAEESTKHIIENILSVQPPAANTLIKNVLDVQQQLAGIRSANASTLNPAQLQSTTNRFLSQTGQAYNTYVNSVINPNMAGARPSQGSALPGNPSTRSVAPHRGTVFQSPTEDDHEIYTKLSSGAKSIPIPKSGGNLSLTGTTSDNDLNLLDGVKIKANASAQNVLPNKKPASQSPTEDDHEIYEKLSSKAKPTPIAKLGDKIQQTGTTSDDDLNLLDGVKIKANASAQNILPNKKPASQSPTEDDHEIYEKLSSEAKPTPIAKLGDKIQQTGTTSDDDINLLDGVKIKAKPDDESNQDEWRHRADENNPDEWESGAYSQKPIPDLQGHDEAEPLSDEKFPDDWATLVDSDNDNDEPIPHARVNVEAKKHKLNITNSTATPKESTLIDDNDPILNSKKVNVEASAKAHEPRSFSVEESQTPEQGMLKPSKDQFLASTQAETEANQQRILTENLPVRQRGVLDTSSIKPDELHVSAYVNVKATGRPVLTAKVSTVKTPYRPTELLNAAIELATAMQEMANIAKASASSDDEHYDHLLDASDLIDDSIRALTITASVSADKSEEPALRESMEAANNLADAVKRLNNACKQLDLAVKNTAEVTPPTPQPAQKSARAKVKNKTMDTRHDLIQALTIAREQFIEDYSAKKLSGGLFGTGLQAGINTMRLEFLTKLLDALKSNQTLPEKEINLYLKDIMTSPQLKKALAPYEADLKNLLAKPEHTFSKPPRPSSNE